MKNDELAMEFIFLLFMFEFVIDDNNGASVSFIGCCWLPYAVHVHMFSALHVKKIDFYE